MSDPFCQRCKCRGEDVFHALVECKAARRIWKFTDLDEEVKHLARQDMLSVIQDVALKRRKKDLEFFVAVCWAIWYSRNRFFFKGRMKIRSNLLPEQEL